MPFEFDPSTIRAELKTEGDHWVVAIELAMDITALFSVGGVRSESAK